MVMATQGIHFCFLLFQGVTFLLVGLDLIGEKMNQWCIELEPKKKDPSIEEDYDC